MRIGILNGVVGGQGSRQAVPETIDFLIHNVAGATITTGYAAALTTTAASLDGAQAVLPAASQIATFVGCAVENIPDNSPGLVRAFGYLASTFIFATGTSVTVGAGVAMGPGVAGSNGVNSTGLLTVLGPVISLAAIGAAINSPGGYAKCLIRAL